MADSLTRASASSEFATAEDLYTSRQFVAAAQHYLNALAAGHPRQAWCHNRRGLCMSQLGRGEDALQCYDVAVLVEPLSAMLRHNRGYRRLRLGYNEGARTDLQVAANLGGETKWGRQARLLLAEHWGEDFQQQEREGTSQKPREAPATPRNDRFARGNNTVKAWLQHDSASPSQMLHHTLDSVGGPLTMTVAPRTPEQLLAANGTKSGQSVQADSAQALPAGFSISSPMLGAATGVAGGAMAQLLGPVASQAASSFHQESSPAHDATPARWRNRSGHPLQVQTSVIPHSDVQDSGAVELCRVACVRQRGGVGEENGTIQLVVEVLTDAVNTGDRKDEDNAKDGRTSRSSGQLLRFDLGDALKNLERAVAVAAPQGHHTRLRSSQYELSAQAEEKLCADKKLPANSDTAQTLKDEGIARLARTVQSQLPPVTNLTPNRLRHAIVRAISSAINQAPVATNATASQSDEVVGQVKQSAEKILPLTSTTTPAPAPAPVPAPTPAPALSPTTLAAKLTSVQSLATQQTPPPVPSAAITPRSTGSPLSASHGPPRLRLASVDEHAGAATKLSQSNSAGYHAYTVRSGHHQGTSSASQRIRALRLEVEQLRKEFPYVVRTRRRDLGDTAA